MTAPATLSLCMIVRDEAEMLPRCLAVVRAELYAQIRALMDSGAAGVGAATVVMRNLLPHGHRRDTPVMRLFRNHPSVRFSFPIHEDVSGAVQARLQADGQVLQHLTGV